MIYCDTSILVAALTTEAQSHIAKPWLLAQQRRDLAVSDWCVTGFANAIMGKHRRGDLDAGYRAAAEYAWTSLRAEFKPVAVTRLHFVRAAGLADRTPNILRSSDALHLAIVLDLGWDLATLDHDMASAARALGISVHPT